MYELTHAVGRKFGDITVEPYPPIDSLDFTYWFKGEKNSIKDKWECPQIIRHSMQKPLSNYVLNSKNFNIFDTKAFEILIPVLDGEVLPCSSQNEDLFFYRPPIYFWHEILDPKQTVFVRWSDAKRLGTEELLAWKVSDFEAWKDDFFSIDKYAFKTNVQDKYLFKIDTAELIGGFQEVYTYATHKFKKIVTKQKLTGFRFHKLDNVIYIDEPIKEC